MGSSVEGHASKLADEAKTPRKSGTLRCLRESALCELVREPTRNRVLAVPLFRRCRRGGAVWIEWWSTLLMVRPAQWLGISGEQIWGWSVQDGE